MSSCAIEWQVPIQESNFFGSMFLPCLMAVLERHGLYDYYMILALVIIDIMSVPPGLSQNKCDWGSMVESNGC
jgi:hypothetical protein